MLFISENPVHVAVKSETREVFDTRGRLVQPKERRLFAKFRRGEAPDWARKIGEEMFEMRQRPEDVPPAQWLSAYDSFEAQQQENLTDSERVLIEQRLLELGYTTVERPKLPAPYPMYDKHRKVHGKRTVEHAIADITAAYETAGFSVDAAVAYELQEQADPQVLAALEALRPVEAEEPEEQVISA